MENLCIDCKQDISFMKKSAKRCVECRKKYLKLLWRTRYKHSDATVQRYKLKNASIKGKEAKRKYGNSFKGKLANLKYRTSEKGKISRQLQLLKRRTKIYRSGGNLTAQELKQIKNEYSSCVFCGSVGKLGVEHLIPVSRRGTNDWHNLVMACRKCNSLKSKSTYEEFFEEYSEKEKYFLNSNLNLLKIKAMKDANLRRPRVKPIRIIWNKEKKRKLIEMWKRSSKEELLNEFKPATWNILHNIIQKMRNQGLIISERKNIGRFGNNEPWNKGKELGKSPEHSIRMRKFYSSGHQVWNKGKIGIMKPNFGSFKKGNIPWNKKSSPKSKIKAKPL